MGKREGGDIVNEAIEEGIELLIKRHPRFRGNEEYLMNNIDRRRLKMGLSYIQNGLSEMGEMDDRDKAEYIHASIVKYVANGKFFDKDAKEAIIDGGLDGKAVKYEKDDEIGKAMSAVNDIRSLMKKGDYRARMPDLAEDFDQLHDIEFYDAAVDVLKSRKVIDEDQYRDMKGHLNYRAQAHLGRAKEGLVKRIYGQESIAAAVIGFVGIVLMLFFGNGLTGAVIGVKVWNYVPALIGAVLIFISGVLFLRKG
jgi:hypothetical protein